MEPSLTIPIGCPGATGVLYRIRNPHLGCSAQGRIRHLSSAELQKHVYFEDFTSERRQLLTLYILTDIPLSSVLSNPKMALEECIPSTHISLPSSSSPVRVKDILVICRQGNDSQVASAALRTALLNGPGSAPDSDVSGAPKHEDGSHPSTVEINQAFADPVAIRDLRGGLFAWHRDVDPLFPIY